MAHDDLHTEHNLQIATFRFVKRWWFVIVGVAAALGTLCSGAFTLGSGYIKRIDAEKEAATSRLIQAQRPFLEEQRKLFFETAKVSGKLIEWGIDPSGEEWRKYTNRFWELRWGELELVSDAGVRQAMRRVGAQIIETEYQPTKNRHDLRWAVECLADEIRLSLEKAWGTNATERQTATGQMTSTLPSGCTAGYGAASTLKGMGKLEAPGNVDAKRAEEEYLKQHLASPASSH